MNEIVEALPGGGCVVLIAGAAAERIVQDYGGDPATAVPADLARLPADGNDRPAVGLRAGCEWSLAVEHNGWQGSRLEVLRRLSAGGRAVSVFWNVNGVTRFRYAVAGRVVTGIDPPQRWGSDPTGLDDLGRDLPWETDPAVAMLELAGRLTGGLPIAEWLAGPLQVAAIEPWPDDPAPIDPMLAPLTYDDPVLAWAIRRAPADRQRAVAARAAGWAAGEAGLPGEADLDRLDRQIASARRRKTLSPIEATGRHFALQGRRAVAEPDPATAALRAAEAAGQVAAVLGRPGDDLRRALLHELGDPPPPAGSLGLTATPGDPYGWLRAHWLAPAGRLTWVRAPVAIPAGRLGRPTLTTDSVRWFRPAGDWTLILDDGRSAAPDPDRPLVRVRWEARGRARLWWNDLRYDPQTGPPPDELRRFRPATPPPPGPAPVLDYLPHLLAMAALITGHDLHPADLDEDFIREAD